MEKMLWYAKLKRKRKNGIAIEDDTKKTPDQHRLEFFNIKVGTLFHFHRCKSCEELFAQTALLF